MSLYVLNFAGMERVYLIKDAVDKKHRARILQERRLETLITRGPRENWQIHPAWVDRYVFKLSSDYTFHTC